MVDAGKVALIGSAGGMVGVEFGSTGAALAADVAIHGSFWIVGELGAEHQGQVPDPAAAPRTCPIRTSRGRSGAGRLRKAKVKFQIKVYSGAGHGFSCRRGRGARRRCRSAPRRDSWGVSSGGSSGASDGSSAARPSLRSGRMMGFADSYHPREYCYGSIDATKAEIATMSSLSSFSTTAFISGTQAPARSPSPQIELARDRHRDWPRSPARRRSP